MALWDIQCVSKRQSPSRYIANTVATQMTIHMSWEAFFSTHHRWANCHAMFPVIIASSVWSILTILSCNLPQRSEAPGVVGHTLKGTGTVSPSEQDWAQVLVVSPTTLYYWRACWLTDLRRSLWIPGPHWHWFTQIIEHTPMHCQSGDPNETASSGCGWKPFADARYCSCLHHSGGEEVHNQGYNPRWHLSWSYPRHPQKTVVSMLDEESYPYGPRRLSWSSAAGPTRVWYVPNASNMCAQHWCACP